MTSSSASSPDSPTSPTRTPAEACTRSSPAQPAVARGALLLLVLVIDAYRALLSPLFRGSCRFDPSCSQYAREALLKHGLRGLVIAGKRLLRCRPYGGFGFDPVP